MTERNTRQKELVMQYLVRLGHPSAGKLYESLHADYPTVSRSTVFRILADAARSGRIRRLQVGDGEDRFDATMRPHAHVRCRMCGEVGDVWLHRSVSMCDWIAQTDGYQVESCELTFTGLCPVCAGKEVQS